MFGFLAGAILTAAVMSQVDRRPRGTLAASRREDTCSVSVILIARKRGSVGGRIVDSATGNGGWTHAAWDACEQVSGVPYGIDCLPGHGVHRRPIADIIGGRAWARVELPLALGLEAYGCARAKVGAPYDAL